MPKLPPNFDQLSPEAQTIVREGLALAEEHDLAVLLVACANKAAADGSLPDQLSARVVVACSAAFKQQTDPKPGRVARKPPRGSN